MMTMLAALVLAAAGAGGGDTFYQPPDPLPAGVHGDVIRKEPLSNAAALPSAARNVVVLYQTQTIAGAAVAVSGTVAVPKGTPPPGGWPIVTWAHGTTGDAPRCTPSLDAGTDKIHDYLHVADEALDDAVAHGYAVVQTDYEGQGTPEAHPYLVGEAEARDVIDMVRAARQAEPSLGTRYVVAGHSEGGLAALFAGSIAQTWAPELTLLGVVALAPASHLDLLLGFMHDADDAASSFEFGSMLIEAYGSTYPDVHPQTFLTPQAYAMLVQTHTRCISDPAGYFASTPGKAVFAPGASIAPLVAAAIANDPSPLHIAVPVLIAQGLEDSVVPYGATGEVRKKYCTNGVSLSYHTYAGLGHIGVVVPAMRDALPWFAQRFAGANATSNCPKA